MKYTIKAKVEETWQKLGLSRSGHLTNKKVTILKRDLQKRILYTPGLIHNKQKDKPNSR